ncbi:NADP-dependent 3-hydroxy acid dehydrogenase YdfG [Nocardiopsis sp. Huas11]|uniref:SDR family oxidoreductase n=1 Tax=Nocardiopsis sp. Huas11 TaxID=2183912 RepID=UPI000EAE371F|nr:SDR family oxidoreductase [Nocardiopsis sp. Huas11]RKS06978.1 NADP-dependent 3-hydroxy acid dehydrogenase YdfG [Nocardiopsis sp. Huas11]
MTGTRKPRSDRVALVCGASAGVGRATVREFARRGYMVGLVARGSEGLEAAAGEARAAGTLAVVAEADVADPAAVEEAAERVESELGPIDVWVNAPLVSVIARFTDVSPEEFHRVTDVCYHGYVHGTRAALDRMLPRDTGVVVQVGSALAYRGIPLQAAYCAAKHAVRGFDDSVRAELAGQGSNVRITEVHLPAVNTPQFSWVRSRVGSPTRPVPPVYQPEVAARAIVWAAEHPRRRSTWVGASTIATALGQRLAPRLLDRRLGDTGAESQMREDEGSPPREDNLFRPLDEDRDYGAHGVFDDEARARSLQQELNQRRLGVAAVVAGVCVTAAAGYTALRGRRGAHASHGPRWRTRPGRSKRGGGAWLSTIPRWTRSGTTSTPW